MLSRSPVIYPSVVAASLFITACSSFQPIPPKVLYEPFKLPSPIEQERKRDSQEPQTDNREEEEEKPVKPPEDGSAAGKNDGKEAPEVITIAEKKIASSEMKAISLKLEELVSSATDAAINSSKDDWNTGDFTSAGAIMAAAGAIADQTGLLNTGIGVGALGATARGRYQFSVQGAHYLKASRSLTCVLNHVNTFPDSLRVIALTYAIIVEPQGNTETDKAQRTKAELLKQSALEAPLIAVDAVSKIQYQLLADLSGIGSEPTTRDQIDALVKASEKAGSPVPTATDTQVKNLREQTQGSVRAYFAGSSEAGQSSTSEKDITWLKELAAKRALSFEVNVKACVVK